MTSHNPPLPIATSERHHESYLSACDVVGSVSIGRRRGGRTRDQADPAKLQGGRRGRSHYADGHKGVAIEVKIDPDEPTLTPVTYSPFNQIFTEHSDLDLNYPNIFHGKYKAWRYEKEWRIVTTEPYFSLSTPCRKILLGPRIEREQSEILRMALPKRVRLVETRIENSIGENLPRVVPIKRKAIESRDGNSNP